MHVFAKTSSQPCSARASTNQSVFNNAKQVGAIVPVDPSHLSSDLDSSHVVIPTSNLIGVMFEHGRLRCNQLPAYRSTMFIASAKFASMLTGVDLLLTPTPLTVFYMCLPILDRPHYLSNFTPI
jgi:hypothetical protein